MQIGKTNIPLLDVPILTRTRIWFALLVAGVVDALQLMFGPLGWAFIDEGLDVVAMIVVSATIGFHTLLLPTFVIEFIPVADMLPSWTACTAAVIMLRKRAQPPAAPPRQEPPPSGPPPIDISAEVTRVPPKL